MRDFAIGLALIFSGIFLAIVFRPEIVVAKQTAWVILPLVFILAGGAFQIKAFVVEKKKLNALDKKFKNLSGG
jgi:hypothetical protein